jgi:hypothetical protein
MEFSKWIFKKDRMSRDPGFLKLDKKLPLSRLRKTLIEVEELEARLKACGKLVNLLPLFLFEPGN